MFDPLDEEENVVEEPNPIYYYTKIVTDEKDNEKEDPKLVFINGHHDMSEIYNIVNKKDDSSKGEDEGVLLIKTPHIATHQELIDQIKQDGLNVIKPGDEDGDEIITAIYYITEQIRHKPKEVNKLLEGNIPLKLFLFAKAKEGKDDDKAVEKEVPEEDTETAENKLPDEMVRDIMKYSLGTLDQITVAPDSNEFLSKKTSFGDTIARTLQNDINDKKYLLTGLHSLGNYLYSESGNNYSKLDLPKIYELLQEIQSKYYADPEVLTQVNYISGSLVKNLKDDARGKEFSKKFYELIPESTKCQDHDKDLVLLSLKLMHDGLVKKPYLVEETYDETVPTTLSLLKLYRDNPDVQENGYSILSLFGKNKPFAASMINNGILPTIKETLDNAVVSDNLKDKNKSIRGEIFKLLSNLAQDELNTPKIADEIMGQLVEDLKRNGYSEDSNGKEIIKLLDTLLNTSQCAAPFVQFGGIDACINLLEKNDSNVELVKNLFNIFKKVSDASDDYKKMLQEKKLPDLINRVIKKVGVYDKKIEYEGRQLLFNVNLTKAKPEDPNKSNISEIRAFEPIPSEVKHFLINGKQVKVISENGDVNNAHLSFSNNLMKVSPKKPKTDVPLDTKYVIDTTSIKKIVKGHGTDAFQKSKGFFRSIPGPERCFSIIGPTTVDGVQSLNIECENEQDVNEWIKNMQIVVNYYKKTQA